MASALKSENHFELQLVVTGILIPLYLDVLPRIIRPFQSYFNLTMELPKVTSYFMGALWFICLILGTFSLAFKKNPLGKRTTSFYYGMFLFNTVITGIFLVVLITAYSTVLLTILLMSPHLKLPAFAQIITPLILISILGIIAIHFWLKKNNIRGGKNVKK